MWRSPREHVIGKLSQVETLNLRLLSEVSHLLKSILKAIDANLCHYPLSIGQRFALSVLKTVLALALRHFRFESMEKMDKIFYNMERATESAAQDAHLRTRSEPNTDKFDELFYVRQKRVERD